VIWIAGGTDKGNDYSELYALAKEKVKALVCLGVDNEKWKTQCIFVKVLQNIRGICHK
jgi:UDP-N-acetylmuramoylalanine-D-glutamate ligase